MRGARRELLEWGISLPSEGYNEEPPHCIATTYVIRYFKIPKGDYR